MSAKSCSLSWLKPPPISRPPPTLTHKSPPVATQILQSIPSPSPSPPTTSFRSPQVPSFSQTKRHRFLTITKVQQHSRNSSYTHDSSASNSTTQLNARSNSAKRIKISIFFFVFVCQQILIKKTEFYVSVY